MQTDQKSIPPQKGQEKQTKSLCQIQIPENQEKDEKNQEQKTKNAQRSQHHIPHHHGQHHHHYHHVQPQLIIKPEQLVDPGPYLMDIYKMKQKVDSYYQKNTQHYVDYWKREAGVEFTLDGYQLIFYDIVINMEDFLKQDWRNVEYIGFSGCKIDDIKWRLFADHVNLFPNLKWLSLQIKHTINVKQGDLQRFNSLQRIEFKYEQWTHPLTIPSKNYLKTFAKNHSKVQVVFG